LYLWYVGGEVRIREIEAKSILRKHKKIDSWFVSQYGLNPYRGCSHSCVYCDGRAEGYYTYGEFGEDIDILKEINAQSRAIVSMSFSSANEEIARIFEPGVPSREERLETLAYFKSEGITCGMFLLPVIPFSTDTPELIGGALGKAREAGVDFVIFGGMTLKDGRQKDHFINSLSEYYPELVEEYRSIYPGSR